MMDLRTRSNDPALELVPPTFESGMRRAVCRNCGAHAAVIAAGASITGACSVCGSRELLVLDAKLPPPRGWAD